MSDLFGVGTPPVPLTAPARDAGGGSSLDYEAFLQLLTTQLQNQDPTEPMDSTEYVAQLATFSQVEQQIRTNLQLEQLLTASALSLADGVVGRTVTAPDGVSGRVEAVRITAGGPVALLAGGAEVLLGQGVVVS